MHRISVFFCFLHLWVYPSILQGSQDAYFNESQTEDVWKIQDQNSSLPCILLKGEIEFKVHFTDFEMSTVTVPRNASADGNCMSLWRDYQDIKLVWNTFNLESSKNLTNSVYFGFSTNWTSDYSDLSIGSNEYALNTVTVVYHGKTIRDSKGTTQISYSASDFIAFRTPKNQSFSCSSKRTEIMGDLELTVSNFQFEAFKVDGEHSSFSSGIQCSVDDKGATYYFLKILQWLLIAGFAIFLFGAFLVLILGIFHKRRDIIDFGYRLLGKA